jgi:hypothetical protein
VQASAFYGKLIYRGYLANTTFDFDSESNQLDCAPLTGEKI